MTSMKYEIGKFVGFEDFSLWKRKMKNILIQQEVDTILEEDFPVDTNPRIMKTNLKKARSYIELYLVDNVL